MDTKHRARPPAEPVEADRPPAFTGNLDRDVEAALDWLWEHPKRWLVDDAGAETDDTPGHAA